MPEPFADLLFYLDIHSQDYGLAILDAPFIPLCCATLASSTFYCLLFSIIGANAASLVKAIKGEGKVNPISFLASIAGILITLGTIFYIKKIVKAEIEKVKRSAADADGVEIVKANAGENAGENDAILDYVP